MITAHHENVATIVSTTFHSSYQSIYHAYGGPLWDPNAINVLDLLNGVRKVRIKIWKIPIHFLYKSTVVTSFCQNFEVCPCKIHVYNNLDQLAI